MTIQDGRLVPDGTDEILDEMITNAEVAFGEDLNPDDASVIRAFYLPIAEFLAEQQQEMANVLDASQLDHASGVQLDLLASLIGVTRREANAARTTLRFSRESEATQSFTVPDGTIVQTDAVDAVEFETTESTAIEQIEGFEDNSLSPYNGDTGVFSIQSSTTYDGSSYALEGGSTVGTIIDPDNIFYEGCVFHGYLNLATDTAAGYAFGVQDEDNHYRVYADAANSELTLDVVSDGSVSNANSSNQSIPTGEWVKIKVDWRPDDELEATLFNSSGTSLTSVTTSQGSSTYTEGGIGFFSGDATGTKYYDNLTMTAAGVPGESVSEGVDQNVATDRLTVMPNAPTGVASVTNIVAAEGGSNRETDTSYRERAKEELAEGSAATENALLSSVQKIGNPKTVDIIVNDEPSADGDGRPAHTFEVITDVDSSFYDDVAEAIINTKAAGDVPVGGYAGSKVTRSVELINGETKDVDFTIPTNVKIYFDVDITKDETYAGDEVLQDSIVGYVGGTLNSTESIGGEISTGDDVLFYQVAEAIMDVRGVVDITNLEFDATTTPSGTSNYAIGDGEAAIANATDGTISVTSSDV